MMSFNDFGFRINVQWFLVFIGLQECTLDLNDVGNNFAEIKQQLYANGVGWGQKGMMKCSKCGLSQFTKVGKLWRCNFCEVGKEC